MRIRWTKFAVRDFTHICDHSDTNFGLSRGRRTALAIHDAVNSLITFPHLGPPGRKPGTSELVIVGLPFVAIYRVKDDVVQVVRVLHGAQKWP